MSELSSYLNDSAGSDLQITALIESWGGRLRTRKQWQSFLGLKLKKARVSSGIFKCFVNYTFTTSFKAFPE